MKRRIARAPPQGALHGCMTRLARRLQRIHTKKHYIYTPLSGLPNACTCRAGSVCLDVINQTWSPMFDLINVFEVFLPQLLLYPNPSDPLNGEAASLLMREPQAYNARVRGGALEVLGSFGAEVAGERGGKGKGYGDVALATGFLVGKLLSAFVMPRTLGVLLLMRID
eukprot:366085-Chlamydomonas_euryale.AAC.14